jgi:hypothetical protein
MKLESESRLPSRVDFARSGSPTTVSPPAPRHPDDLVPPITEAERALAQRAQRTIAGSAGASALTYPHSDTRPTTDPRMRPFFSPPERLPEQRFEPPQPSPFLPSAIEPLSFAPVPQRGRAHAAIDDLLASSKPQAPRPSFWPHASEAAATSAMRTCRRGIAIC